MFPGWGLTGKRKAFSQRFTAHPGSRFRADVTRESCIVLRYPSRRSYLVKPRASAMIIAVAAIRTARIVVAATTGISSFTHEPILL
jgi:hypothetical protein